jgi:hypothetical protein
MSVLAWLTAVTVANPISLDRPRATFPHTTFGKFVFRAAITISAGNARRILFT